MNPEAQAAAEMGVNVAAVIGSLIMGGLVGMIPLFMGRSRDDGVVGTVGFLACLVGGFLAGILGAGSMAVGFVIAILAGGRRG